MNAERLCGIRTGVREQRWARTTIVLWRWQLRSGRGARWWASCRGGECWRWPVCRSGEEERVGEKRCSFVTSLRAAVGVLSDVRGKRLEIRESVGGGRSPTRAENAGRGAGTSYALL